MSERLLIAVVSGLLIALASYRVKFLTISGSVATFILALIIFGIGGWQWTVPIVSFFLLSSLLSKYGSRRKSPYDSVFEKSSTRDWGQVVANGGVAAIITILSAVFPAYDLYPLYLGALAAATADTWGTEIGILGRGITVSVLTFRPVATGTSGGISEKGTYGGAAGAAIIALAGYPWYTELQTAFIVIAAGIIGSLADSFIGATLQAQYKCSVCGKATERAEHCSHPTDLSRGLKWIGNDVVNGICTLVGAAVVWGMLLL
jgi:uncharacterized protein (TIGR00297 family)